MYVRILSRAVSRVEEEEEAEEAFSEEEEDFVVLFCRLKGGCYVNMGLFYPYTKSLLSLTERWMLCQHGSLLPLY